MRILLVLFMLIATNAHAEDWFGDMKKDYEVKLKDSLETIEQPKEAEPEKVIVYKIPTANVQRRSYMTGDSVSYGNIVSYDSSSYQQE